jgi:hypothetical protein
MPFTAVDDGDIVWPDDVDDGATVECPNCGDGMHVRSGHTTEDGVLKPRCFVHNPDASVGGLCPGGESDEHKLMKYVVSRRLRRMFDHGTVQRERGIPETERVGDVVVTFGESFQEFGRGVVAEVQYRHDEKDIEAVTTEYLQAGFSVYWLNESYFGENYETVEFPDLITAWPNAVPPASEWSGIEYPEEQLGEMGERYPMEAKFPPDFVEDHRETLERWWRMGASEYDFDLVRPLSANNAGRSCAMCGDPAVVYLFQDGVISTFRCERHLPEGVDEEFGKTTSHGGFTRSDSTRGDNNEQ